MKVRRVLAITLVALTLLLMTGISNATLLSGGFGPNYNSKVATSTGTITFVVPDIVSTGKISGVGAASPIDWVSMGILESFTTTGATIQIIKDTNSAYFDSVTGRPLTAKFPDGSVLVLIGGAGVNNVVKYYESTDPAYGGAPVRGAVDSTNAWFTAYGATISGTSLALSAIGSSKDNFLLEVFKDDITPTPGVWNIFIIYGFSGYGSRAGPVFWRFLIEMYNWNGLQVNSFVKAYYIVQWSDAASGVSHNGLPDDTGGGAPNDSYAIIATATAHPLG